MKKIPLHGKYANGKMLICDDEDFELLNIITWHVNKDDRISGSKNNKTVRPHIILLGKQPRGVVIDHKNHLQNDVRRENLRICTQKENRYNSHAQKNTSSRFKGVVWNKRHHGWSASIRIDGKLIWLGTYYIEEHAAARVNQEIKKYHGEFALFNEVSSDIIPLSIENKIKQNKDHGCQKAYNGGYCVRISINGKGNYIHYSMDKEECRKTWDFSIKFLGLDRYINGCDISNFKPSDIVIDRLKRIKDKYGRG